MKHWGRGEVELSPDRHQGANRSIPEHKLLGCTTSIEEEPIAVVRLNGLDRRPISMRPNAKGASWEVCSRAENELPGTPHQRFDCTPAAGGKHLVQK